MKHDAFIHLGEGWTINISHIISIEKLKDSSSIIYLSNGHTIKSVFDPPQIIRLINLAKDAERNDQVQMYLDLDAERERQREKDHNELP